MIAVIQRVKRARVVADGVLSGSIGAGLYILLGVASGDEERDATALAEKISKLRIFSDANGKMNLSVIDKGLEILSVSQFTLLADTSHGNRPGFTFAEKPELAIKMYDYFCEKLAEYGVPVKKGVFGADMKIEQLNDGPVTIIIEA